MGHPVGLTRVSFLTMIVSLASMSCGPCNARGVITSLSPNRGTAGGDQFVLTVNGSNFVRNSVVLWNGHPVVTTYITSNQLLAEIPASDIVAAGTSLVFVFNPPNNSTAIFAFTSNNSCGGESNGIAFTVGS
jgi:hypothetical protein